MFMDPVKVLEACNLQPSYTVAGLWRWCRIRPAALLHIALVPQGQVFTAIEINERDMSPVCSLAMQLIHHLSNLLSCALGRH